MLHERGIMVETLRFHQMRSGSDTATFVRGTDGTRTEWAMGWADDPTQSALRALIACANRLYGRTCRVASLTTAGSCQWHDGFRLGDRPRHPRLERTRVIGIPSAGSGMPP